MYINCGLSVSRMDGLLTTFMKVGRTFPLRHFVVHLTKQQSFSVPRPMPRRVYKHKILLDENWTRANTTLNLISALMSSMLCTTYALLAYLTRSCMTLLSRQVASSSPNARDFEVLLGSQEDCGLISIRRTGILS